MTYETHQSFFSYLAEIVEAEGLKAGEKVFKRKGYTIVSHEHNGKLSLRKFLKGSYVFLGTIELVNNKAVIDKMPDDLIYFQEIAINNSRTNKSF
jgi:hypothetical protein